MNLIQVQEQLKSLPSSPQTMQALMQYANGMNPAVPPYLALGELNRRKQLMEEAQQQAAGQPPQGTVKDQVQQAAGLMALQQGRQQQAMQQMAQGMGQMQGRVPPQTAAAGPVQMASGGIVALSGGNLVDRLMERERVMDEGGGGGFMPDVPEGEDEEARRIRLMQEAARFRQARPKREDYDPEAMRKRMLAENPELAAAANKDVGAELMKRLEEMQALRRAEIEKQRAEAARLKPSVLQQLGQAAMGTRGQYGRSALASILGGYSDIASKEEARGVEQERGLREKELALQQAKFEAQNKLDEAARAKAEGRIDDYIKNMREYQKIKKDYEVASMGLLRGEITATESAAARQQVARTNAAAAAEKARIAANKPTRTTDFRLDVMTKYEKIKADNPEMSDVAAMDQAVREARAGMQVPQMAGVAQRTRAAADEQVNRAELFGTATWKKYVAEAGGDSAKAREKYIQDYQKGVLSDVPEPGAKPAAQQRKVGDTEVVRNGPNKGKTVVWDGTGWKLQQ